MTELTEPAVRPSTHVQRIRGRFAALRPRLLAIALALLPLLLAACNKNGGSGY